MASLVRNGYLVSDLVLSASACETIGGQLPEADAGRGGVRDLLRLPIVRSIVEDPRMVRAIRDAAAEPLVAVKATLFDKTQSANWPRAVASGPKLYLSSPHVRIPALT